MQACYYASTTPVAPVLVSFNAGGSGSHCLNNVGQSRTVVVSQSGVNCVDSGYVEGKDSSTGGDNCAVESSLWTLSYTTNSTGESGFMSSRWQSGWLSDNKVTLQKQSKGTEVCGQASLCGSTSIHWTHGSDTLYVRMPVQSVGSFIDHGT